MLLKATLADLTTEQRLFALGPLPLRASPRHTVMSRQNFGLSGGLYCGGESFCRAIPSIVTAPWSDGRSIISLVTLPKRSANKLGVAVEMVFKFLHCHRQADIPMQTD